MVRQLWNGKWNPVVYDNGFIPMTYMDWESGEYKLVECDTKEEAEQQVKEYQEFWKA